MTTVHVITSHGADFVGEDRYTLRQLQDIAEYVRGAASATRTEVLVRLLTTAGTESHSIAPHQAAAFADLLRTATTHMTRKLAAPTRLLAAAADRAAADNGPWTWTPTTTPTT